MKIFIKKMVLSSICFVTILSPLYGSEFLQNYFQLPLDIEKKIQLSPDVTMCYDYYAASYYVPDCKSPELGDLVVTNDPIEGYNRSISTFNGALIKYLFWPVGTVWSTIFPKYAIERIQDFSSNVEVLRRFFSCLLQERYEDSGMVMARFGINTTVGVLGFYDAAYKWFGIYPRDEDFGQAFASWGIGSGPYFVLPLLGPSTIRDSVGKIFDFALDPKTYIFLLVPVPGVSATFSVNKMTLYHEEVIMFMDGYNDPYQTSKILWTLQRRMSIRN